MPTFKMLTAHLRNVLRAGWSLIAVVMGHIFGQWHWQQPDWLGRLRELTAGGRRWLGAHPARAALFGGLVLAAGGGYYWASTRPTPHYVTYGVRPPALTTYNENGIATISPMTVVFNESVAPLKQLQKVVTTGIELAPAIAGAWYWRSDKELQFTPTADWPVDGEFSVRMARKDFVANQVRLKGYTFTFESAPFVAVISESQFYQDPINPNLKKLVATVRFSHPVDAAQLEQLVSLDVAKDAEYLGLTPDSRHFTVSYDKFKLSAFVHSAALAMPRDDTPMTLNIDKGVRAARGGNATGARLRAVVTIPGRTSLRFANALMTVVDNARYEPEQVLLLASSSPVAERAFTDKVSMRLLPARHPRQPKEDVQPYEWQDVAEIGGGILEQSAPLAITYVPSDEGGNTSHGFKFLAPVGRHVFVTVKDGVQGTGGYLSGKPFVATVKVAPYRQALTFLGQGALLSLTGDRKVGFLVRDVDQVEVEIGRVLPNQLQHLVPQMWDFSKPSLYDDLESRIVERFTATRDYTGKPPGKPTYDSIDVGEYLQDKTGSRRGLFLLHIRPAAASRRDDGGEEGPGDTRLILVTDLGLIVKRAKDERRDVFVQSIRTGQPVAGAHIEITGVNGEPVLEATTDASGRAQLPKPERLFRDHAPLLILAQKDGDVSFVPMASGGRELELSRFDTGGVEGAASAQQLSTYLFSDRGIYRPGETTHLGVITRTADWQASLAGLPLDVEISDPRGLVVSKSQLKLSAASFDEINFTSQAGAPTGIYQAVAYLPKENHRRETLGSTSFKVQEFEPDRMKVQVDLAEAAVSGWLRPEEVKARVTAAQLFGEPAANRRVEGEMSLTSAIPSFARFTDYRFQIGEALTEPYREDLAPVVTDDKGVAVFNLDLKRFVGRAYRLNVLGRAFEAEGGRNVAAQDSVIVSDAPYLVGVKPDGELAFVQRASVRTARWMAVNQQLAPVPAAGLTLDWVQRKFLSVLTQQSNGTFKYVSRLKEVVRDSRSVSISAGGTAFTLPTAEPGDFVMVLRDATGAELSKLSYTVAGQANLTRSLERNTELQVQLDKPAYSGGDTIAVSIRAPYVGAGLITIERERVFHHQWFRTTTTSSIQRVTLPQDFEGNGYVSVQFLRDPASDELFMSPLSYGVAPFAANLETRTQAVSLTVPGVVKPGAMMTMRITVQEPSRVSVLAVDEGILQVAKYRNPDPLGYFFQKRMLEVQTQQILDLILPDFKRFIAMAAPGGDADGGFARQLNPFNRKHKPPVAFWSGVIDVGAGGRELRYVVPDYFSGRLRIVAIGASLRRVGVAEAATEVKGDFILTPNVPVMTAPGDEFVVSVGLFNNTTGGSGPIQLQAQLGPGLSLRSAASIDLQIADKKEGVAEFRIRANAVLGATSLRFIAKRGVAEARLEESVSVRPAVAFRTQLTLGRVTDSTAVANLTRDMFSERRKVEAASSALPLVWGQGLVAYLDNYTYSCTEQLVSKGMAALVLAARPEFGAVKSAGAQPLDATFSVLRNRVNAQGGFGLWSSSPQASEFATVYAAHFLVEGRDRGQKIPPEILANTNEWLTRFASTPAGTLADGRLRAYAVYLLVRQGIKPNAAIANVEQELTRRNPQTWTTDLAAAYLASTYRLMQRNADADRIVKDVPWSPEKRGIGDEIYYDAVVHDAQLLYLLARHFPNRVNTTPPAALETLAAAISGNRATSLSAAYTLLALDAFSRVSGGVVKLGISEIGKDGREKVLPLPAGVMPRVSVSEAAAKLQFSKSGPLTVYYVVNESGFDRNPPVAELSQGMEIVREFLDAQGTPVTRVTVGQEFLVRLRVRATTRDRQPQIAIVDLLPGGVEPVLELQPSSDSSEAGADPAQMRQGGAPASLPIGVPGKSDWFPHHIDVRDDRLVLYGDATKNVGTFTYRARATNAGVFQTPPAFAEGMYDRSVVALSKSAKLEIVKP